MIYHDLPIPNGDFRVRYVVFLSSSEYIIIHNIPVIFQSYINIYIWYPLSYPLSCYHHNGIYLTRGEHLPIRLGHGLPSTAGLYAPAGGRYGWWRWFYGPKNPVEKPWETIGKYSTMGKYGKIWKHQGKLWENMEKPWENNV